MKFLELVFVVLITISECNVYSQQELSTKDMIEMLDAVNLLRIEGCKCGDVKKPKVQKLIWNDKLEQAAIVHAADMEKVDKLSHQGSDGSEFYQRIERTGYVARASGENVAWNFVTVESAVEGWKNSTGHCNNMTSKEFTEMGAAKIGTYWVQVFADGFK